ncbi:MAG: peptide-methionine (S)-S-oxide reductase MsrA [Cytophagales bacterium]|nr:peptide-methionine (S)-S-oxide reductase MsrA [Cytophagales bacterium]
MKILLSLGILMGMEVSAQSLQKATFGAGCFWCVEAVFQELKGVENVISGYAGGKISEATYQHVSRGNTGHAEVVQISYDPDIIGYEKLLEVFWKTHDPTTKNKQGNDIGKQYRSVIFYHTQTQYKEAQRYKNLLNERNTFSAPVITEIVPFQAFYEAEQRHQDFYTLNPNQPYCRTIIEPKLEKFRKIFPLEIRKSP